MSWKDTYRARYLDVLKAKRIKLLGKIADPLVGVPHQCLTCTHRWAPTPANILHTAAGCPECGKRSILKLRLEKKRAEFSALLKANNVRLVGEFAGMEQRVSLEWQCGHSADLTPKGTVRRGFTCPTCTKPKAKSLLDAPRKEFLHALAARGYTLLGEYTGTSNKHRIQCGRCQHSWRTRTYVITGGSGCPVCANLGGFKVKRVRVGGRVFEVQGYEPVALRCIKAHGISMREVVHGRLKVPRFTYEQNGKTHMYYPDFQIRQSVVEVKSLWTAGLNPTYPDSLKYLRTLKAKARAVIEAGYKFKLLIFKGNETKGWSVAHLPDNWLKLSQRQFIKEIKWKRVLRK